MLNASAPVPSSDASSSASASEYSDKDLIEDFKVQVVDQKSVFNFDVLKYLYNFEE